MASRVRRSPANVTVLPPPETVFRLSQDSSQSSPAASTIALALAGMLGSAGSPRRTSAERKTKSGIDDPTWIPGSDTPIIRAIAVTSSAFVTDAVYSQRFVHQRKSGQV